jgi:hypothetical protein
LSSPRRFHLALSIQPEQRAFLRAILADSGKSRDVLATKTQWQPGASRLSRVSSEG